MVVPKDLIDVVSRAKWLMDRHSSLIQQQVLSDFITEGHLERHIRKMRAVYAGRRKLMIDVLKGLFGNDVTIYGDNAGINVLIRLNASVSDDELVARARKLGVGIASTRHMYLGDAPRGEFHLNYGGLKDQDVIEGLTRLRAAMDRQDDLLPVE
jgi:GntR family transcriptional regulator/MocR family aminotransferase